LKLKRIKTKKLSLDYIKKNIVVFDTETTKLEPMPKNFVFGVIFSYDEYKVIYSVKDFKKEFKKPKYKNKYIFAHNAEFDLLTIFGNIFQNVDNEAIFNGGFISAKYNDFIFADSLNILLSSVKSIGQKLNLQKFENSKIKNQGLRKSNISKQDIEYCIQDCRVVFVGLVKVFESIGAIKITLASLAFYDFRKNYLKKDIYYNDLVYEFFDSYYGGRNEAFKIGNVKANVYDINSLYPFAMLNVKFPNVGKLKKETKIATKYFKFLLSHYEGMAKVTINHKETKFGFIPLRKEGKLLFPSGNYTTYVNFNEIRFALDNKVIDILKVHYAIFSKPTENPFINFVNHNYKMRFKSHSDFDKYFYKIKLNSLYGRFAMRLKYKTEYLNEIPFDLIKEFEKEKIYYELSIFSENRADCYFTTESKKLKNSYYAIPTFSSYITSYARIHLLKHLLKNEDTIYCDTDSIFTTSNFNGNISKKLGDFKKEDKEVIEIRGLKNYSFVDLKTNKVINKIKGINFNHAVQLSKNKFEISKYLKTKEALRRNKDAGTSIKQVKELRHVYDKRILLENGETKILKL